MIFGAQRPRIAAFLAVGVCLFVLYRWLHPDTWAGFVYPDKNDLTTSTEIGPYPSLQVCRESAQRVLASIPGNGELRRGDFECGLNCDDGSKMGGIKVCEETTR